MAPEHFLAPSNNCRLFLKKENQLPRQKIGSNFSKSHAGTKNNNSFENIFSNSDTGEGYYSGENNTVFPKPRLLEKFQQFQADKEKHRQHGPNRKIYTLLRRAKNFRTVQNDLFSA